MSENDFSIKHATGNLIAFTDNLYLAHQVIVSKSKAYIHMSIRGDISIKMSLVK